MSAINVEDLHARLHLLESSVPHAWVSWDDPKTIHVEKSTCEDILPRGDYRLENIVTGECLKEITSYYQNISTRTQETNFTISNNGQVCDVTCSSVLTGGNIISLWFVIPEKDNSILYLQNAAHDFRSPLASILGVVNLMHHSIRNDEDIDRGEMTTYLDMIKVSTDKTLRLADEIMELAEIESESYELRMSPIVVRDFVSNYLATHRLITLKKKIKVQFDSDLDSVAMINESKLTRALDNILSNAVKFSKPDSIIKVQLLEEDEDILLIIADQGIGMSPDILKNVFVKFGSSKRAGLDGEPSHGLGMSIVQQIMRLHGGNVKITSNEGIGTSVSLILKKKL